MPTDQNDWRCTVDERKIYIKKERKKKKKRKRKKERNEQKYNLSNLHDI